MLLTYQQFREIAESDQCKTLHDRSMPLVAWPWQNVYLGYVPVSWGDGPANSVEDADDWKEVDIVCIGSESDALHALRSVFGEHAVLEDCEG